jgi:hypothetical protein
MDWYLWPVLFCAGIGFFVSPFALGRVVMGRWSAVVMALIARPVMMWLIGMGGASAGLVFLCSMLHAADIIDSIAWAGKYRRIGGGAVLWNLALWGVTAVAVIQAATVA